MNIFKASIEGGTIKNARKTTLLVFHNFMMGKFLVFLSARIQILTLQRARSESA
jgi:hypothetical protein